MSSRSLSTHTQDGKPFLSWWWKQDAPISLHVEQQTGLLFEDKEEPQLCCQKKVVLSKTWWFKVEFLFRLTSLCRFFSEAVCLPKGKVKLLSHIQLFAAPWAVAHQAPPSMEFSRQEYWSGLPFPSPGDLPNPGIEPGSPALQADALLSEPPGNQISY